MSDCPQDRDTPARLSVLRGEPEDRTPLAGIIAGGYDGIPALPDKPWRMPPPSAQPWNIPSKEVPRLRESWRLFRPARLGRTALALRENGGLFDYLQQARIQHRQEGSPLGLVHSVFNYETQRTVSAPVRTYGEPGARTFWELRDAVTVTLFEAAQHWADDQHARYADTSSVQGPDTKAADSYHQLEEIVAYGGAIGALDRGNVAYHIQRGVATAVDTTWQVLEAIPRVFAQEHGTPIRREELRRIARNSLPLLMHLAAGHEERALPLLRAMYQRDGTLDARYLMLVGEGKDAAVTLKQRALEELKAPDGTPIAALPLHSKTIGCPGMNYIPQLLEWAIGFAEMTYFLAYD